MAASSLELTLRNALHGLHSAFFEIDVTRYNERIVVEIPEEAGRRLEAWLMSHLPIERHQGDGNGFRLVDADSQNPKREVTVQGVAIRWPTGRVMTQHGVAPRPLPDEVIVIEAAAT